MPKRFADKKRAPKQQATRFESLVFVDDLEVWVIRKNIKNANLRIKNQSARIEFSCPIYFPQEEIIKFIRQKRPWIDKSIARIKTSPSYLAESATTEEKKLWRDLVSSLTPGLIAKWEPIIGVKAGPLAFRNMKSRWGSCQPATGRICINTRLALYPPDCLEYVVVHELCHLIERGHGPKFKALLDKHLPNWRDSKAKLK
jgi:hypothetical protein